MSEETEVQSAAPEAPASESWRDTLPEDLKDDPILARFNDVPAMAKALVSAQKMVGADKIAIPSAGDAEAWGKVYDRLGRPKNGDAYDLAPPAGFSTDDGMIAGYRETAHGLGLSAEQAKGLFDWFMGAEGARHGGIHEQLAAMMRDNEMTLRREWGAAYDDKIALASAAVHALLGDGGVGELNANGYGTDPFVLRLLAEVGERVVEGRVDGEGPRSLGRSPGEARNEIARLQGDQDFIRSYQDRTHPDHADAVARMSGLYQQAYPGGDGAG